MNRIALKPFAYKRGRFEEIILLGFELWSVFSLLSGQGHGDREVSGMLISTECSQPLKSIIS